MDIKSTLYYKLTVQIGSTATAIEIESPIGMKAKIQRDTGASLNSGNIIIYNLSESRRNLIAKTRYNTAQYTIVKLSAGYNKNALGQIFVGNILEAYSIRSGNNIETHILAQDGGFAANNAYINKTYNAGFTFRNLINEIVSTITNVKTPQGIINSGIELGKIGNIQPDKSFSRSVALNGNSFTILNKYFQYQTFMDNEILHMLASNDVFVGQVFLISSNTGLLGTPVIYDNALDVETIFEPQILVGQVVELESSIFKNINGQWKVQGIYHTLDIIEGGSCRAMTRLNLFLGNAILNIIP